MHAPTHPEQAGPRSRRRTRLVGALAVALPLTAVLAAGTPASAAPSSLRCSGYAACSRGAFTTHGYQLHASASYWTMYPGDNCTNYVAYVESTVYGVATPSFNLGDGGAWAANARRNGVPVNHVPTVGAVAVWVGGSSGIPYPGHVAVVERVGPRASYVDISQQHMSDDVDGYDWTRIYRDPAQNEWQDWPDYFVHFRGGPGPLVDGVHFGSDRTTPDALEVADGRLATTGAHGAHLWHLGVAVSTSPSVTAEPNGFELAFQAATHRLEAVGSDGLHRFGLRLRPGTSPSITAVRGGYELAAQASNGHLVTVGTLGERSWPYRVRQGTSPSITALIGGGYEVAFQSSHGTLESVGTGGHRTWNFGLKASTSPSITADFAGGYEIAVQTNAGFLLTAGTHGVRNWHVRLRSSTSPSISPAFNGGVEVAFQSPSGLVEAIGSLGLRRWHVRAEVGTSPSIESLYGGGFEVVVHASNGHAVEVGSRGERVWRLKLAVGTSPAARP